MLAGWTQKEIGDSEDLTQQAIDKSFTTFGKIANFSKTHQTAANFADGFEPPLYNVWTAKNKSNSVDHFGNSEQRWLDNLLYLYTEPFGDSKSGILPNLNPSIIYELAAPSTSEDGRRKEKIY